MKLLSVKTQQEAQDVSGLDIEFVHVNGHIQEVHVAGLVIKKEGSYTETLSVLKRQFFEEVERHRVTYTVADITHEKLFDDYSAASDFVRQLRETLPYDNVTQETVKLQQLVDGCGDPECAAACPEF